MNHFYRTLQGWFDWEPVYTAAVKSIPDHTPALFVEVGAWKGMSTAHLATEIVNSGKPIKLDVVDGFDGRGHVNDDGTPEYKDFTADIDAGLLNIFTRNMEPVASAYRVVQSDATEAAAQYEDASIDFIFFDVSIVYDELKAMINAWLPKLKPGAYIAGHDYYSYPHSRVSFVVKELFPNHLISNNTWYSRVGSDDLESFRALVSPAGVFSQDVGPAQSDAYYRGKYARAAVGTTTSPDGSEVTPDRKEYMRGKYAAF